MKTTFKLGPLQTLWLKQLRAHPERQGRSSLGWGNPKKYKACCLGEIHLCAARLAKKKLPFVDGKIVDTNNEKVLKTAYLNYGLRSENGSSNNFDQSCLSSLNDNELSWTEIADLIEKKPSNYFTKSV